MRPRFARPALRSRSRGQSLVEFAIAFPVLMLLIGGIIQFGVIFWGQNTLTQVARDTGRWAATQSSCDATAAANILTTANAIAGSSSLIGYSSGSWTSPSNVVVSWSGNGGGPAPSPCPPTSNVQVAFVSITIHHRVPTFFLWVPGDGNLTTVAQFRMEPHP
jgi:Flp pilus assembly protein TadG